MISLNIFKSCLQGRSPLKRFFNLFSKLIIRPSNLLIKIPIPFINKCNVFIILNLSSSWKLFFPELRVGWYLNFLTTRYLGLRNNTFHLVFLKCRLNCWFLVDYHEMIRNQLWLWSLVPSVKGYGGFRYLHRQHQYPKTRQPSSL